MHQTPTLQAIQSPTLLESELKTTPQEGTIEEALEWISVKLKKEQRIITPITASEEHMLRMYSILGHLILWVRCPSTNYAASTQLGKVQDAFRWHKEVTQVDLGATTQGRALLRNLRIAKFNHSRKAKAYDFDELMEMFAAVSDGNQRMNTLMLIAFAVAARIGHLDKLIHRKMTPAGWRLAWLKHKTFYKIGQGDIMIPNAAIPAQILAHVKELKNNAMICTTEEKDQLYKLLTEAYHGKTYTIRRSSIQHMRDVLGMKEQAIIEITLHSSVAVLKGYMATNMADIRDSDDEEEVLRMEDKPKREVKKKAAATGTGRKASGLKKIATKRALQAKKPKVKKTIHQRKSKA